MIYPVARSIISRKSSLIIFHPSCLVGCSKSFTVHSIREQLILLGSQFLIYKKCYAGHLWTTFGISRYFLLRMCTKWATKQLNPLAQMWVKGWIAVEMKLKTIYLGYHLSAHLSIEFCYLYEKLPRHDASSPLGKEKFQLDAVTCDLLNLVSSLAFSVCISIIWLIFQRLFSSDEFYFYS